MEFGFVGNAAAMADLDPLARYTRDAFAALKKAAPKAALTPQAALRSDPPTRPRKLAPAAATREGAQRVASGTR